MEDYLDFISGIVGDGIIIPLLFTMAIIGPFAVCKLVRDDKPGWINLVKWLVAILTFFSCLLLWVSTGGYIGGKFGSVDIGMGAGLVVFYYSYNGFTSLLPSTCSIENK